MFFELEPIVNKLVNKFTDFVFLVKNIYFIFIFHKFVSHLIYIFIFIFYIVFFIYYFF